MKAQNLHDLWSSPDNSRITSKQYSFRLPVHVAAKIEALCEMYPSKNRTQIVGDLLASALEELAKGLPLQQGKEIAEVPETGEVIYEQWGPAVEFWELVEKHQAQIEKEMGNEKPTPIRPGPKAGKED